jgi:hypothetical protein
MRLWRSACLAAAIWGALHSSSSGARHSLGRSNVILPPTINAIEEPRSPPLYGTACGNAVTERSQSQRNRAELAVGRAPPDCARSTDDECWASNRPTKGGVKRGLSWPEMNEYTSDYNRG